MLYPQGRLRPGPVDPEAVEEKYGVAPSSTATSRRWSARPATTCRACPGSGPKTAAKWISQYGALRRAGRPGRRDQGQGRDEPARTPRRRDAQLRAQPSWSPTSSCRCDPDDTPGRAGTGRRSTRSSTPWSSASCATGSTSTSSRSSRRPRRASTWPGSVLGRARSRLAGRARPAGAAGRRRGPGHLRPRHRSLTGVAIATADGAAAWFDPAALDADDEAAVAAWLADPAGPR